MAGDLACPECGEELALRRRLDTGDVYRPPDQPDEVTLGCGSCLAVTTITITAVGPTAPTTADLRLRHPGREVADLREFLQGAGREALLGRVRALAAESFLLLRVSEIFDAAALAIPGAPILRRPALLPLRPGFRPHPTDARLDAACLPDGPRWLVRADSLPIATATSARAMTIHHEGCCAIVPAGTRARVVDVEPRRTSIGIELEALDNYAEPGGLGLLWTTLDVIT